MSVYNVLSLFFFVSTLQLKRHVVTIDGYTDVPPNDEKQLLKAVASQPVSVGICGSGRAFQLYSKVGILLKNYYILVLDGYGDLQFNHSKIIIVELVSQSCRSLPCHLKT